MTGLNENEAINIGTNVNNEICKQIRINKVDELHWKTINYLIKNIRQYLWGI